MALETFIRSESSTATKICFKRPEAIGLRVFASGLHNPNGLSFEPEADLRGWCFGLNFGG
jgi:hypothetical protein